MEQTLNPPLSTEGLPAETGSQAADTGTQVQDQQQPVGAPQVEGVVQSQSSQGGERVPPSQFYGDRRALRNVQEGLGTLSGRVDEILGHLQRLSSPPATQTQTPRRNPDDFYKDPEAYLENWWRERETNIQNTIPSILDEKQREFEFQRSRQEALKLINANESVNSDPNGLDKIKDILLDPQYNLETLSKSYPVEAARLALTLYAQKSNSSKSGGSIPTKSQMTSTATGVGASQQAPTLELEAQKMTKMLESDPMLAYDPKFQEQIKNLRERRMQTERRFAPKE